MEITGNLLRQSWSFDEMEVIDEKDFQTYIRNEVQNDPQFGNIEESKESKKNGACWR